MSLPDPGRDSKEGVQGMSGTNDFDVVLEARGNGEISERRYVHVITEAWTFVLTGPAQCRDDSVHVEVDFHVSDPQIDARMQVVSATARTDRTLTIVHAGLPPVTMPPGSTTVFQGTPLAGLWSLTTPLKKGESCTAGEGNPPPAPALIVSGTCGGVPRIVQRGSISADSAPRCGNLGQPCCAGGTCAGKYECLAGLKACYDPKRPSFMTSGQRCNDKPATALSRTYYVGVRDPNKCGAIMTQLADSLEEANACSRQQAGPTATIVSGRLVQYDFCKNRNTQLFVPAFSDDDATDCARRTWPRARLIPGFCERP